MRRIREYVIGTGFHGSAGSVVPGGGRPSGRVRHAGAAVRNGGRHRTRVVRPLLPRRCHRTGRGASAEQPYRQPLTALRTTNFGSLATTSALPKSLRSLMWYPR